MDTGKSNRATAITKALSALEEASRTEAAARKREIDQWIAALAAAEVAAVKANTKSRSFQVNYRIKNSTSKKRGKAEQRRSALIALLESLKPAEKHTSTSTWIISLHIESAEKILDLLKGPVAPFDYLAIAEVGPNRAKFGDADLE